MFKKYLIVIPIVAAAIVLSFNLSKPFIGHHDFTGAFNGKIAKNYLTYGVGNLKFGQIAGFVEYPLSKNSFYTDYAPLMPLSIALSFSIFGVTEWAERLVSALFSVLAVVSFFLICQKLWNRKTALITSMFFVLNPMFIYYGSLPVAEPPVLGMMLLALYFYLSWLEKSEQRYFIFMCMALFIGGLYGWPIVYFGPLIIMHSILIKKFRPQMLWPTLVIGASVGVQFVHSYILTGYFIHPSSLSSLRSRLAESNLSFGGIDFNLMTYLKQEFSWLQVYYTRVIIVLSGLFVLRNLNLKFNTQKATVLFLLLFGLGHPIIFSRYVFIHDFLNIYLLPFFAISAALGLKFITEILDRYKPSKKLGLVVTIIVLILFTTERFDYTKALLATSMNKPGQDMAYLLNSLQKSDNEAVILSPRFNSFYGVFTTFYSKYGYVVANQSEIEKDDQVTRYKYIITIDEDITDKSFIDDLTAKYKSRRMNDQTVFYIDEKN